MNHEAWTQIVSSEVCIDLVSSIFNLEVTALMCELDGEDRGRLRKQEKREGGVAKWKYCRVQVESGLQESMQSLPLAATGAKISATAFRGSQEQCQRLTQRVCFIFFFFPLPTLPNPSDTVKRHSGNMLT